MNESIRHGEKSAQGQSVFVVEDQTETRELIALWLQESGFTPTGFQSAERLFDALTRATADVICLDLGLPGESGLQVLEKLMTRQRAPVIVVTADTDVETVVEALRLGATDYIAKPASRTKVIAAVRSAVRNQTMARRLQVLERKVEGRGFERLVGKSAAMQALYVELDRIAESDISVLILGESGTGKELVAQSIHEGSARRRGPFVAVNCAAIPESLQEAEFFGHEKGSFTGATERRVGKLEAADGGTLFLDEVGELDSGLQAKLLRALQERRFERIGGTRTIQSDFRLIAATNRDVSAMVRAGKFREDLYYRIAVYEFVVPPLRERPDDVARLFEALQERMFPGRQVKTLSVDAEACMRAYEWPGNVRELANLTQRLHLHDDVVIGAKHLPEKLQKFAQFTAFASEPRTVEDFRKMKMETLEAWAIENALRAAAGDVVKAAQHLGIGRSTLYRKLKDPSSTGD